MFKTLNLLITLLYFIQFSAQNYIDLAKLSYSNTPLNQFDSNQFSTQLQEIKGDLTFPIVVNDKLTLLSGVTYENLSASFYLNRGQESMTSALLKLGTNIKHNEKWSGTYMLLPKISSDFNNLSHQDFQLGGVVLLKKTKSNHLNYKIGFYANNELFGPFLVPIFGFYYLSPSEKFEAKVLVPIAADLNYCIAKNTLFGIDFKGLVRSFNLNDPNDIENKSYLAKSTNDVYSYLQYDIKSGVNIQLGIGRSLGRSYRVYDDKVSFALPLVSFNDNRNQLNTDFSDGWLFKVGIFYRLKIK